MWYLGVFPTQWIHLSGNFRQHVLRVSNIHSMLLVNSQPVSGRKLTEKFISTWDLTHHPHRKLLTQVQKCLTWGGLILSPLSSTGNVFSGHRGQWPTHPRCSSSYTPQRLAKFSKLTNTEKHLAKRGKPWSEKAPRQCAERARTWYNRQGSALGGTARLGYFICRCHQVDSTANTSL